MHSSKTVAHSAPAAAQKEKNTIKENNETNEDTAIKIETEIDKETEIESVIEAVVDELIVSVGQSLHGGGDAPDSPAPTLVDVDIIDTKNFFSKTVSPIGKQN